MRKVVSIVIMGCMCLAGCNKSEPEAAAAAPAAAPTAAAAEKAPGAAPTESGADVFKGRCVPCHGESGKGDGPGAAALNPKPRDYTDAAWQKSVTDEDIKKAILYGGAAVGKSPAMPSHPDLEAKPEVLNGVIKVIRDFGPK